MGLNIIDRIQAKIELFRLEQRYTRRRHRRSTFVSNAIYVDGEYIYQSPNTTGSSSSTARSSAASSSSASGQKKRQHRWSVMPGFGSSSSSAAKQQTPVVGPLPPNAGETATDWRKKRVSFHEEW